MSTSSWVKEIQERVKRASNDVNVALQPRVAQAKRSLEASIQQIGLRAGPEVFQDDKELYDALMELDELRAIVMNLSRSVEQQRSQFLELSRMTSNVSANLQRDTLIQMSRRHLSSGRVDAQLSLGNAQIFSANAMSRFALDMSTPMADLSRTFDETLQSKITPLRRRYLTQKREYMSFSKQAMDTDDNERREHLQAVAQSSAWRSTSDNLMAEIRSLTTYTLQKLSDWSLDVAQAEREMLARSARAFEQPAAQAEAAQNDSFPTAPPS